MVLANAVCARSESNKLCRHWPQHTRVRFSRKPQWCGNHAQTHCGWSGDLDANAILASA